MSVPQGYPNGQQQAVNSATTFKAVLTHVASEKKWVKLYVQKDYTSVTFIESYLEENEDALSRQSGYMHQTQLSLGTACLARFTDDKWYRAAVSAWPKSDTTFVEVTFIDYGNPEIVSVADIRSGDETVLRTPPLAMECFLDGVDVLRLSPKEASEIIEHIKDTLLYEEVTLRVLRHEPVQPDCYRPVVSVQLPTGEDLLETLTNNSDDHEAFRYPALPLGSTAQVFVSHTNAMDDFYLHLASRDPTAFTDSMQGYFAADPPRPVAAVTEGMACVTRFSEDRLFYRSSVLSFDGSGCSVLFVDYGNSETKAPAEIFAVPRAFLDEPVYALHCAVANSPVDLKGFRDVTQDAAMNCKFVGRCGPTKYVVEFPDLGSPPAPIGLGRLHFEPGLTVAMYISYVESAGVVYGQVKDMAAEIEEISQKLAAEGRRASRETADPKPGAAVLCRYEDCWYRAEVIESGQKVTVWIADYGDTVAVDRSDIRPLAPDFLLQPACAVKLALHEYECNPANVESATTELQNLLLDAETRVQIVKSFPDGLHLAKIFVGDPPVSVVKKLTKEEIRVPRPTLGATECLTVMTATPPRSFFGQLSRFPVEDLDALQKSLAAHYGALKPDPAFRPVRDQHVCCKFTEDGLFYRARVVSIEPAGHYGVFYLDFGNEETVPVENVHPLDVRFAVVPQFGIQCCLDALAKGADVSALVDEEIEVKPLREEGEFHVVALVSPPLGAGTALSAVAGPPPPVITTDVQRAPTFVPARLEAGRKTTVDVVFVASPAEFYCQSKAHEAELNALMDAVAAVETEPPFPSSQLKIEVPCAARYSEDRGWYRAKVRELTAGKAVVFFVDYGNVETVDCADLRLLPPELLKLPAQAVRCRLADVVPSGGGAWPEPTTLRFDALVSAEAVTADVLSQNAAEECYDVELTLSGGESVGSLLVREGLAALRGNVSDRTSAVERGFQYRGLPVGTSADVTVSWVLNPGEVFLQITDSAEKLDRLMEELQTHYANSSAGREPVRSGQACVAKFSEDGMWYRARVTHAKGTKLGVHYVDYGNCEEVAEADVRKIIPPFLELPAQAIRCRIRGLRPPGASWPAVDSGGPLDAVLAGVLRCRASADRDGLHLVDLERASDGVSVAELVIAAGLGRPAGTGGGSASEASLSSKPKACIPPAELSFQTGQYVDVKVTAVSSVEEVWCCMLNALDPIADAMAKAVTSTKKLANPCSGEACIARFLDGEWARATIRSRPSPAKIEVYFVDVGITRAVHHAEVKPINQEVAELPAQAFRCSLLVECRTVDTDALKSIVGKELVLEVKATRDGCVEGHLYDTSGKDEVNVLDAIAHRIQEEAKPSSDGLQQAAHAGGDFVPPKKEESHKTERSPPHRAAHHRGREPSGGHVVVPCYAPLSKITGKMAAYVTHVEGPGCFYVMRKEQEADLEALSERLQERGGGGEPVAPIPKLPCIAVFHEDSRWYRARVVSPLDNSRARVHFVDYGNTAEASEMRSVDSDFLEIPPFCYKCKLEGARELSQVPGVCERFRSMVEDAELEMEVVTWGHEVTVKLRKDGVDVVEELTESEEVVIERRMKISPVEGEVLCTISHVSGVDSFYACPAEKEDVLADFVERMQEAFALEKPVAKIPKVGEDCVAMFSEDGQWYRATVLEVGEATKVLFVDYGNTDSVDSVAELPAHFSDFPVYCFECRLERTDPSKVDVETFKGLVEEGNILVKVVEWGQPAVVKLLTSDGTDVSARPRPAKAAEDEPALPQDVPKEAFVETEDYGRLPVALNEKTQVKVCHIVSPADFFVQFDDYSSKLAEIEAVLEEMPVRDGEFVPTIGSQCAALYSDGLAYRASVVQASEGVAKVFFVDYGNTESVAVDNTFPLPSVLRSVPALAVHCRLDVDDEQACDAEVGERFRELAGDKGFLASFLREEEGTYAVRLLDMGIDILPFVLATKEDATNESPIEDITSSSVESTVACNVTNEAEDSVFDERVEEVAIEEPLTGTEDKEENLSASEASDTKLMAGSLELCEEGIEELTVSVEEGESREIVQESIAETAVEEPAVEDRSIAEESTNKVKAAVDEEHIEPETSREPCDTSSFENDAERSDLLSEVERTKEEQKDETEETSITEEAEEAPYDGNGTNNVDVLSATENLSEETSTAAVTEPEEPPLRDAAEQSCVVEAAAEDTVRDGATEEPAVHGPAKEETATENLCVEHDLTNVSREDIVADEEGEAEHPESVVAARDVVRISMAEAEDPKMEIPPVKPIASCNGDSRKTLKNGEMEADGAVVAEDSPSPGEGEASAREQKNEGPDDEGESRDRSDVPQQ